MTRKLRVAIVSKSFPGRRLQGLLQEMWQASAEGTNFKLQERWRFKSRRETRSMPAAGYMAEGIGKVELLLGRVVPFPSEKLAIETPCSFR